MVQEGVDAQTGVRAGRDGRLYLFTDLGAPRGRIAVADPATVGNPADWWDLIREDPEAVLDGYAILDGAELARPVLVASWARHALSEITMHDLASGDVVDRVALPGLGTAGGLSERPEGGHEAWFGYTDYTTPPLMLRFDARDSSVHVWATARGAVAVPAVTARQVTYPSADGTLVRMLVISGAAEPAQPRPALLTGYGGFDISLTPGYSANALAWVEAGGVYAVANLRGGNEEGEEWHRAGMLEHKQNVFDDFRCAAEALIRDGWTTSGQLAISGGSNGGLLVGAALVQRPPLYAAVICSAPLLDMVRYERFGLGQTWNVEYGSAADPEQLGWLLSYSPYHHVLPGHGLSGRAVHRVHQRHPGRPGARVQDVRGAAGRHVVPAVAAGAAAGGGPGGARGARGEPDGGAGRGHAGVRGPVHRARGCLGFAFAVRGPGRAVASRAAVSAGVCGGMLVCGFCHADRELRPRPRDSVPAGLGPDPQR